MPVRVGFAGAGGIASAHMSVLQAVEDVLIVAVADVDRERAESAAARFAGTPYADAREMLEREKLDALYVCVPPYAHADTELLAAERGVHLFVEKPVAVCLERAHEVREAIASKGVISAVGYHWRYQANADRARQLLEDRQVGMVFGYWMGGFPGVHWWRRREQSGGQMVEQTTHIFDLARYLCGDVAEVYACYANRCSDAIEDFNIWDVGTATLRFESGAVGAISNTILLDLPYRVGLDIVAPDLVIEIRGDLKVIEPGHTETFSGGPNPMLEENRAFIHAVATGDRSRIRSTYEDATRTLAVTLACNASADIGQPVRPEC